MNIFPESVDVVVIGAGIIGLTTALELARRGRRVCVVERDEVGQQCSWAGGGMLIPVPPEMPTPQVQKLLLRSQQIYPNYCARLLDETGIDPEYWACGARLIEPSGDTWLPQAAQVRNPRLLKALGRALAQLQVPIIEHTVVVGWRLNGQQIDGVRTSTGDIACKQVVLAAGAWSSELAAVDIRPVKGQMLLLRGALGQLDHIRIGHHGYLIPRRDGRILIGSTIEDAGFDTAPTVEARELLLKRARTLWPDAHTLEVENHWAGLRPVTADEQPLIGPSPDIKGLFFNTGHYRLGLTLAPASAERLIQVMTEPSPKSQ
jgi:glycine oxidase